MKSADLMPNNSTSSVKKANAGNSVLFLPQRTGNNKNYRKIKLIGLISKHMYRIYIQIFNKSYNFLKVLNNTPRANNSSAITLTKK